MRFFLLLFALLGGGHAAFAQAAQAQPQPEVLRPALPNTDTAAAIHRLFTAKRKRQVIISGATFGVAVGAVVAVALSSQQPSGGGGGGFGILTTSGPILDNQAVAVMGIGITMIPVVLIEALLFGGWNKKQEQQTIEAWQQHKEARFLKRKLKPKYFAALPPPK